jgi:hypothetical protein
VIGSYDKILIIVILARLSKKKRIVTSCHGQSRLARRPPIVNTISSLSGTTIRPQLSSHPHRASWARPTGASAFQRHRTIWARPTGASTSSLILARRVATSRPAPEEDRAPRWKAPPAASAGSSSSLGPWPAPTGPGKPMTSEFRSLLLRAPRRRLLPQSYGGDSLANQNSPVDVARVQSVENSTEGERGKCEEVRRVRASHE